MIHNNFIIREGTPKAHIFEGGRDDDGKFWANIWPLCGMSVDVGYRRSDAGDGRPVCRVCAKIAKRRGWV